MAKRLAKNLKAHHNIKYDATECCRRALLGYKQQNCIFKEKIHKYAHIKKHAHIFINIRYIHIYILYYHKDEKKHVDIRIHICNYMYKSVNIYTYINITYHGYIHTHIQNAKKNTERI